MKNNKKIAIICNYVLTPDRVGGMDRFFWLFDEKCKTEGYDISWYFPNTSSHGKYGNLNLIDPKNQPLEDFFIAHIKENNLQYDTVVTHFVELCTPFYKKIKLHYSSKIVCIDHNPRPLNGYPIKKQIIKKIKGLLYSKYTDLFVGVSEYTKRHLLNDFGNPITNKCIVIYNGILHELFEKRSNRNRNHPTFLVACHLRKSKGIQDLIAAVSLLPSDIKSKIKIDIYGDGDFKEYLKSMISDKNLIHNFDFKGSVSNLYEVYCKYDYLLQPTHMECFSLSILESLSANVPVITTSVGGNEEVISHGNNGYIFKPEDINALKVILENIFIGKDYISQKTNYLIESKFSINTMVLQHIEIL